MNELEVLKLVCTLDTVFLFSNVEPIMQSPADKISLEWEWNCFSCRYITVYITQVSDIKEALYESTMYNDHAQMN